MGEVTLKSFLRGIDLLGGQLTELSLGTRKPADLGKGISFEESQPRQLVQYVPPQYVERQESGFVNPVTGSMVLGGCGTTGGGSIRWDYSGSIGSFGSFGDGVVMRTECRQPQPNEVKRTQLGDMVLMDNGDDRFDLNCQYDYFTNKAGQRLSLSDVSVQEFLGKLGMDKEKAPVVNLNEVGNYANVVEANIPAIKGATDETVVWQKYQEIEKAAGKAGIPSGIDSPLYKRVLAEAGPMAYAIPLGMARESANNGYLDGMITKLAAVEACARQSGKMDSAIAAKIAETRLTGFSQAIAEVEKGSARTGYIDGANSSLDHILEKAKECGILSVIEGDVRRVRVAAHMAAVKEVASGSARTGYVDGMNSSFASIEASAGKYQILPDIAAELAKTKKSGYLNAIAEVEKGSARTGYIDGANSSLDHILEKAKECGILSVIEGDVRRVRVAAHMAAVKEVASGSARTGYVDGMNSSFASIEASAGKYQILPDIAAELAKTKKSGYLNAIAEVEKGSAHTGYIDGANASLDHILEKAKECGILSVIEGDVRRVRVAAHMAAIKEVASGSAATGYVDGMNSSLGNIEASAKKYSIYDDVKDEINKTRAIGIANSQKK